MLLAYIDEVGETGAFIARDDPRFNTSPAFGYAGFVISADHARAFGQAFYENKRTLFRREIETATHPGRWERKGSDIFRPDTLEQAPHTTRVFNALVRKLREHNGWLFYYVDEKPIGTPKQTNLDTEARETHAMREALNRLARHTHEQDSNILIMMDQINEKTRAARLPAMYSHILGRGSHYPEMRRIIEPPMHIDSALSSNIQFADWVAACITRAIDYQLIKESRYQWVATDHALAAVQGSFTHDSKIHLHKRALPDLSHSNIFRARRPLHPTTKGQKVGDVDPTVFHRMKAAAERNH